MLSSIHPLGERARGNRWGVTVTLFTAAAATGGALVGGTVGALGSLIGRDPRLATATAVAAAALVIDLTGRNTALARPRRQVDERWLTSYRRWVYAAGWGLQLGSGVVTVMPAATVWLSFALAGLTGSPAWGATIGAVFGATRGATLLAPIRVRDPSALRALHAAMAARARTAHHVAAAADAAVVLLAVTALAG